MTYQAALFYGICQCITWIRETWIMKNAWNTHRIECFRHFYRHFFCTHLVQIHKPRFSLKTPCLSGIQWSFTICISRIQVYQKRLLFHSFSFTFWVNFCFLFSGFQRPILRAFQLLHFSTFTDSGLTHSFRLSGKPDQTRDDFRKNCFLRTNSVF